MGSIPGILISSRWTVSVPQLTIRGGLGGYAHHQRGSGCSIRTSPTGVLGRVRHARGRLGGLHGGGDARARGRLPNRPNRFLNRSPVESARFAAGSLDDRPPGPAPGHRCCLRAHRAPEAHQEPDLRHRCDEDVLAGLPLRDRHGADPFQAAASGLVTVTIVGSGGGRRHGRYRRDRAEGRRDVPLERAHHDRRRGQRVGVPAAGRARERAPDDPHAEQDHDRHRRCRRCSPRATGTGSSSPAAITRSASNTPSARRRTRPCTRLVVASSSAARAG